MCMAMLATSVCSSPTAAGHGSKDARYFGELVRRVSWRRTCVEDAQTSIVQHQISVASEKLHFEICIRQHVIAHDPNVR
jgi:hypothetical protein